MKDVYFNSVAMSGLFHYLQPEDYDAVWNELGISPRIFNDQQLIYNQDEVIHHAAIVHQGQVKGEKLHQEGTSHLAYIYTRGEVFAFEGAISRKHTSPLDFIADGDCVILFFDVRKILTSTYSRELITGLMEMLANDNIKKLYRIETLSQRGLRARILTHFQIIAKMRNSNTFRIPMSRQQLADYLCVNRTALSNELNQMKREGIIDFEKQTFTLL